MLHARKSRTITEIYRTHCNCLSVVKYLCSEEVRPNCQFCITSGFQTHNLVDFQTVALATQPNIAKIIIYKSINDKNKHNVPFPKHPTLVPPFRGTYKIMQTINLCFQYVSFSKRFVPEVINFLRGLLFLCIKKDSPKSKFQSSLFCYKYITQLSDFMYIGMSQL